MKTLPVKQLPVSVQFVPGLLVCKNMLPRHQENGGRFCSVFLYDTYSAQVWPRIWVKAVTSSHECMHHGAGILIQTPPKNPLPRCGELLGLSQLLVTPSLSTHQWVRIRFSLFCRGERNGNWEAKGLQSLHLNNASMFKEWPHGREAIGFACARSEAWLPRFHMPICKIY